MARFSKFAGFAALIFAGMAGTWAVAQSMSEEYPTADAHDRSQFGDLSSQGVTKLADYLDRVRQINRDLYGHAKPTEPARDQTAAAVKALALPCDVHEGALVAQGTGEINGKSTDVSVYEAACSNGMGYLLVTPQGQAPQAMSCFAADGMRADAATQGRQDSFVCSLAANADVKAMAGVVMARAGTTCEPNELSWQGQSPRTHSDYTEVTCGGGSGYILATAAVGSPGGAPRRVVARMRRRKVCVASVRPRHPSPLCPATELFKQALVQNGRDLPRRRRARGRPVKACASAAWWNSSAPTAPAVWSRSFPGADATAKFEYLDCLGASTRGVACQYVTRDALRLQLSAAMGHAGKACDVTDYRIVAVSPKGAAGEVAVLNTVHRWATSWCWRRAAPKSAAPPIAHMRKRATARWPRTRNMCTEKSESLAESIR